MSVFIGNRIRDNSGIWNITGNDISLNRTLVTGNVGIGTSNPQYTVDVLGNARVRGIIVADSIPNQPVQDLLDWSSNNVTERYTMRNIGIGITNPVNAFDISGNVVISSGIINTICITGSSNVNTVNDVKNITHYGDISYSMLMPQNTMHVSCANIGYSNSDLYHTNLNIIGNVYASDIVMSYDDQYDFSVTSAMYSNNGSNQRTNAFTYINKYGSFVMNAVSGAGKTIGGSTTRKIAYFPTGYENEQADSVYQNTERTMVITKTGKVFSIGNNSNNSSGVDGAVVASGTTLTNLTRSFTRDVSNTDLSAANVQFKKILLPEGDSTTSYALTTTGDLYAVGWNDYGQLADGTNTETNLKAVKCPNLVNFTIGRVRNFVKDAVVLGSAWNDGTTTWYPNTLVVLDNSGGIWSAGAGTFGFQNGQFSSTNVNVLTRVKTSQTGTINSGIVSIYGYGFDRILGFMALSNTGKLYAWGNNSANTLINGTSSDISCANIINTSITALYPSDVSDVSNVWLTNDEDGPFFVQTTAGLVYGTGQYYGLGTNVTSGTGWRKITHFDQTTKRLVNLYTVIGSYNQEQSNFAVTRNTSTDVHTLWATGNNANGQLGLGNTTYQNSWINTGLHSDIVKQIKNIVGEGTNYVCILLNNGRILHAGQRIPLYNSTATNTRFTYYS
jgi:alpha-tubulin suppressor-like RCC1 family protein